MTIELRKRAEPKDCRYQEKSQNTTPREHGVAKMKNRRRLMLKHAKPYRSLRVGNKAFIGKETFEEAYKSSLQRMI